MHISQILWILYVADGVQTNQEAEAKKKHTNGETHIYLQTIRWTADVCWRALLTQAT